MFATCYVLTYILFATGVCLYVWTHTNINYMYIFDVSAKHKITHW